MAVRQELSEEAEHPVRGALRAVPLQRWQLRVGQLPALREQLRVRLLGRLWPKEPACHLLLRQMAYRMAQPPLLLRLTQWR